MITAKLTDTVSPKWEKAEKELKKLDKAFSDIGIHKGERVKDGDFLILRAAANEFGSGNIPTRAFMRDWFDSNTKKIKNFANNLVYEVMDGKLTAKQALEKLGKFGAKGIKKSIKTFSSPPNAPRTIKKKGFNDPLIETKALLNGIKHKEAFKK